MSTISADVLVVGGGIAGLSAAYELAGLGSVVLIEREATLGEHATGRSAAIFVESYGSAAVRVLTNDSRPFLEAGALPDQSGSLLRPRGLLHVRTANTGPAAPRPDDRFVTAIDVAEARRLAPVLSRDQLRGAYYEASAADIDVHGLVSGYAKGLRQRGGRIIFGCELREARRNGSAWEVSAGHETLRAPVLVNAAGAWADQVAERLGASPLGLSPRRRSAALVEAPQDPSGWPMVVDLEETVYFKPESGRLMVSPADETPCAPGDPQPEEIDIATAIDRFERLVSFSVRRVSHRWAGLRTFAPDRNPVIGFDPQVEGLFWLAGQGGFGVQTSPAAAALTRALIAGDGGARLSEAVSPGRLAGVRSPGRIA